VDRHRSDRKGHSGVFLRRVVLGLLYALGCDLSSVGRRTQLLFEALLDSWAWKATPGS
jgi:hypothetical protein